MQYYNVQHMKYLLVVDVFFLSMFLSQMVIKILSDTQIADTNLVFSSNLYY